MPLTTLQMAQEAMNLFEGFESPNTMPWRKEAGDIEPGYQYKKKYTDCTQKLEGIRCYVRTVMARASFSDIADFIRKNDLGNCDEMAFIAFNYLRKTYPNVNCCVARTDVDPKKAHVFVLFGYSMGAEKSKSLKLMGLNSSAIWCDPWARKCDKVNTVHGGDWRDSGNTSKAIKEHYGLDKDGFLVHEINGMAIVNPGALA